MTNQEFQEFLWGLISSLESTADRWEAEALKRGGSIYGLDQWPKGAACIARSYAVRLRQEANDQRIPCPYPAEERLRQWKRRKAGIAEHAEPYAPWMWQNAS